MTGLLSASTSHAPAASAAPGRTAGSPPLVLPGEHFAAALVYFVIGTLGLVAVAPELASGAFFHPRVIAVVHLFTLGWIMLSIFGALCQFLPVAVDQPIRWEWLAHGSFALQATGVAIFVAALATSHAPSLYVGATLVSAAFLVFAVNLAATLAGAVERSLTWWALAGACVFLVVTPVYGFLLALNLHSGMLAAERFAVVARHAHVAIAGVVLLVMVGVAHRLLPMFLLSHGAGERPAWAAAGLLFGGAALLAVPVGGLATAAPAGLLVAAGVAAFLRQAYAFYRHGRRTKADPGMRLAAAGLIGLAGALLVAPFALSAGLGNPTLLTTYHLLLIGALSLFVAGHYYKIVPFLIWYHRFGPLVGLQTVPRVHDLYSQRLAASNALVLVAGWAGLVAGTALGSVYVVRAAALVFAAGAVVEALMVAAIARRRPA